MDRNSKYSAVALSSLAIVALAVGGVFYISNNSIQADTVATQTQVADPTFPLKLGWNEISNLSTIVTPNSVYIQTTQATFTLQEAIDNKIVGKVFLQEGNKELGKDIYYIPVRKTFLINCLTIENVPQLIVK